MSEDSEGRRERVLGTIRDRLGKNGAASPERNAVVVMTSAVG